jgi:hypothetical protein
MIIIKNLSKNSKKITNSALITAYLPVLRGQTGEKGESRIPVLKGDCGKIG